MKRKTRKISRATRWTVGEWLNIRAVAKATGKTPSEVVREGTGWYVQLLASGFADDGQLFTMGELRALIDERRTTGRLPRAAGRTKD